MEPSGKGTTMGASNGSQKLGSAKKAYSRVTIFLFLFGVAGYVVAFIFKTAGAKCAEWHYVSFHKSFERGRDVHL